MSNHIKKAGDGFLAVFRPIFSLLGLSSSVLFAAFAYITLWPDAIYRFVPNLATPTIAIEEMGKLGAIALGYLILQFLAMLTRNPGKIWAEMTDLAFSLIPLFVVIIAIRENGWGVGYQLWISRLFLMAIAADIVIVTMVVFRLLLLANDAFISN